MYCLFSLASSSKFLIYIFFQFFFNIFLMNTSEQHKVTRGSWLLDLFLRPVVELLGLLTVGERGEVKNRESPESTTKVGCCQGR